MEKLTLMGAVALLVGFAFTANANAADSTRPNNPEVTDMAEPSDEFEVLPGDKDQDSRDRDWETRSENIPTSEIDRDRLASKHPEANR